MEERVITIKATTILKVIGLLVALYILFLVREIIFALFVSVLLASVIEPLATRFEKKRIPRVWAALLVYVGFFGALGFSFAVLVPVVIRDVPQVSLQIQEYLQNLSFHSSLPFLQNLSSSDLFTETSLRSLFDQVGQIFGGILSFLLVLIFTFYLVIQKDPIGHIVHSIVPDTHLNRVLSTIQKVRDTLGAWFRGQLILGIISGSVVFIGLSLFGIKYAAVSGLLAGILEFIPYLGPASAAVPALLFAFIGGGPGLFFLVLIFYIVIQQIQNNFIAPKVMQKAIGLNPILSIIAVLVGAQFGGILGALIALPVATALKTILEDIFKNKALDSK